MLKKREMGPREEVVRTLGELWSPSTLAFASPPEALRRMDARSSVLVEPAAGSSPPVEPVALGLRCLPSDMALGRRMRRKLKEEERGVPAASAATSSAGSAPSAAALGSVAPAAGAAPSAAGAAAAACWGGAAAPPLGLAGACDVAPASPAGLAAGFLFFLSFRARGIAMLNHALARSGGRSRLARQMGPSKSDPRANPLARQARRANRVARFALGLHMQANARARGATCAAYIAVASRHASRRSDTCRSSWRGSSRCLW